MAMAEEEEERRLIPKSGDPRLFWLDEWFDTPSERAERDRLKAENQKKWGAILSAADTFDEDVDVPGSRAPAKKIIGLDPEWFLVVASAPILLGLSAKVLGVV